MRDRVEIPSCAGGDAGAPRVVDKVVAQVSKPAVSPISNRQRVASELASDISARPQAGSPAIQQVWKPALRWSWPTLSTALPALPATSDFGLKRFCKLLVLTESILI